MKRLNLYTLEEAKWDVIDGRKTGLEASIRKWKLVVKALDAIEDVVDDECGLCEEYRLSDCWSCPLYKSPAKRCGVEDSTYNKSSDSISEALFKARKMLAALEALQT